MGKKKSKKSNAKNNNNNNNNNNAAASANGEGLIMVDPARIRFQHARIRPVFSGCGRSVVGTLDEIREGRLKPSALPPIQVLVGPDDWYFSLNNRRLWVLKRCREEGLLESDDNNNNNNNKIAVRVRKPKSEQEAMRYSVENCALEAKIMPDKSSNNKNNNNNNNKDKVTGNSNGSASDASDEKEEEISRNDTKEAGKADAISELANLDISGAQNLSDEDSDEDDSSEDEGPTNSNRFSALF